MRAGPGASPDRVRALVARPSPNTGYVNLENNPLAPADADALGRSSPAADFRVLILNNCALGDSGVRALLAGQQFGELAALDLGRNGLRNPAAGVIARATHLRGLFFLQLEYNQIGDAGVRALAGAPHLAGLRTLDLGPNRVGPGGVRALAESPYLTGLRYVSLWGNRVGDEGVEALAGSPNAAQLEELYLGNNGITDAGARALLDSPNLMRIRVLRLEDNFAPSYNRIKERTRQRLREPFGVGAEV